MNKNKANIIFILPSLAAGGAERVMSFIAQNINKEKYNVTLVVIGFEKDKAFEVNNVPIIYLNKNRVFTGLLSYILLFKRLKPKVVISAIGNLNDAMGIVSIFFPKCKFIGRIVNIDSVLKHHPEESNRYYPMILSKIGSKGMDYIICQSKDMYQEALNNPILKKRNLVVINNPITKSFNVKKKSIKHESNKVYKFITVGSLERRKGHLRIIEVLSKLDNMDFEYTIIGNGSQKETIFTKISELNLKSKVTHIPFTNNVAEFLSKSDFFLQGSYVEGFPNALIEACSTGTPAIVYDAPGGINEIIKNGINGYIATDDEDFKNKIGLAVSKEWDAENVHKSVYERYNSNVIINKYEELIDSCLKK